MHKVCWAVRRTVVGDYTVQTEYEDEAEAREFFGMLARVMHPSLLRGTLRIELVKLEIKVVESKDRDA